MYVSKNPFTSIVNETYPYLSTEQLNQRLTESWEAFIYWKTTSFGARAKLMNRVADLLDERKEFYGSLIAQEMGKPIMQSEAEVQKCASVCRYYADNALDFLKSRRLGIFLSGRYSVFWLRQSWRAM
jgi:succinate-semialdehyde dehydrogenase/glutarate-semialdehyde dehydrogenase